MEVFTVCFFGHRTLPNSLDLESKLFETVCAILRSHSCVDFLVGRDGEFDLLAAAVVRRAKRQLFDDFCNLIWVQPYAKSEYVHAAADYEQYYDVIEICEISEAAYPKAAFQKRNRAMVDRLDLCIFYVSKTGGAWQTMRYAIKQGKEIINLFTVE